jgi:hypothetical protein
MIYQKGGITPLEYATVLDNNSPLHPNRLPSAEEGLASAGRRFACRATPPIANFVGGVQQGDLLPLSGQGPVTPEEKTWEGWTRRD